MLPDAGPDGPKHVGEARDILTVCFNIISDIKCIRWSQEPICYQNARCNNKNDLVLSLQCKPIYNTSLQVNIRDSNFAVI
jgi:hypothetical protein